VIPRASVPERTNGRPGLSPFGWPAGGLLARLGAPALVEPVAAARA
jgi:hypothetical protein